MELLGILLLNIIFETLDKNNLISMLADFGVVGI